MKRIINLIFTPVFFLMLWSGFYLSCSTQKTVTVIDPAPTPLNLIEDKTGLDYVISAVEKANECLDNPKFIKALNDFKEYEFTDKTPAEISKIAFDAKDSLEVYTYSYFNPFSSVLAYREGNKMFLRSQKLPRSISSIFQSIIHEYFHVLGFDHPFYYEKGRENSVPYKAADLSLVCLD